MGQRITALKVQQHNNQRVNVYLDEEFAFGLSRIVAAWLRVGQELTEEKIAELRGADEREVALQRALHFIEHRPRTEAEVRRNLARHAVPEETMNYVLERLAANGLVNDSKFAQAWVENRSEFRPRSRKALTLEMRRKGLDDTDIQTALQEVDAAQEEQLAYQAAQKQMRKLGELEWMDFRNKLGGFLARRGFDYETIRSVTQKCWQDLQGNQIEE